MAGGALARPARAASRAYRAGQRETVAVFGGGIAGLTAAHELAERGFDVTVYERRAFGGKARSTEVPDSASGGRRPLPGEHGFRIFFGFYQNLPDTMRRIPFESNPNGVFDNFAAAPQTGCSRLGKRDLVLPLGGLDPRPYTPQQVHELVLALLLENDLSPEGAAALANRLVVYFSSCDARRFSEWEETSWRDFIRADRYDGDVRKIFGELPTHFLQSSYADTTSANFAGRIIELITYTLLGRGSNGPVDRILDRPTNEAFIAPWLVELDRLGVSLRLGAAVESLEMRDGEIAGATIRTSGGVENVTADWCVCALPVERAWRLWTPAILAADPRLQRMSSLETAWMNGIQFYLREQTPLVRGHMIYLDSPWALSSISQAQFWANDFGNTYGDGGARDCLSAVISDWETPGVLYGKPARELTPEQVAHEAWEQMKRHVNDSGDAVLTDDLVHSWRLDPGLIARPGGFYDEDPLVTPSVGAWLNRPEAATAIPNLMLAGDYVKSDALMANMETASRTGRMAANAILDHGGSRESRVAVLDSYQPPEWEPLRRIDEALHRAGRPNLFDVGDADLTRLLHL